MSSKREDALSLAEDLLSDIELRRLEPLEIARKASRLARLSDDVEAMQWLHYEVVGYPEGVSGLDAPAWAAATRSSRVYTKEGKQYARTSGIGQLQASIDSAGTLLKSNLAASIALRSGLVASRGELDRIIGSIHVFALTKYQELRFGAAVENIFEGIRARVDANIGRLVPGALPILTTALENADVDNPIQWSNAAKACRDLIKATADALRPPGPDKGGRPMTDSHYVNRLMDWIQINSTSSTMVDLVRSDLDDLGKRLDAVNDSGNKGAHVINVTKEEATRYIVGTYMLIGDILALQRNGDVATQIVIEPVDDTTADDVTAQEAAARSVTIKKSDDDTALKKPAQKKLPAKHKEEA